MSKKKESNNEKLNNSQKNDIENNDTFFQRLKVKFNNFKLEKKESSNNDSSDDKISKKLEKEKLTLKQQEKKKQEKIDRELAIKKHEAERSNLEKQLSKLSTKITAEKEKLEQIKTQYKAENRKEKIKEQEAVIKELQVDKHSLEKYIAKENKEIEKITKLIKRDEKIEDIFKDINEFKREVVNENETFFTITDENNKVRNVFPVTFNVVSAFIKKNIFRKNIDNYDNIRRVSKNIKIKITLSFICSIILTLCFLVTLKFVSSAKEQYGSFETAKTETVDATEEMKKQKEKEEKEKILEAQRKADAARIDENALDEEITAKLAGTFTTYSFNVDRQVTVKKKIHLFASASWADASEVVEVDTKFTVNKLVSPAGYMMYQIASGEHAGMFITANQNFVTIDSKNETIDTSFISRSEAIKFVVAQNIYANEELTQIKGSLATNTILDLKGIGISKNNRLIYFLKDGSFIPVNPVKLTEVNREEEEKKRKEEEKQKAKSTQDDEDDRNSSTKNKKSTTSTNRR